MNDLFPVFPCCGEEIQTFLWNGERVVSAGCAVFSVAPGTRDNYVDHYEVSGQGVDTGVCNPLFGHAFLCKSVSCLVCNKSGLLKFLPVFFLLVSYDEGPQEGCSEKITHCVEREIRIPYLGGETAGHDHSEQPEGPVTSELVGLALTPESDDGDHCIDGNQDKQSYLADKEDVPVFERMIDAFLIYGEKDRCDEVRGNQKRRTG